MARVICTLPHAAATISGVKFTADRGEAISEEISDDKAALFASITGFRLVQADVATNGKKSGAKSPDAPKTDAPKTDAPQVAPQADAKVSSPDAPADAPKAG